MKFGIHYIYWQNDLKCDSYMPYIEKAKKAGFDALELGDILFFRISEKQVEEIAAAAKHYDMELALGLDPPEGCYLTVEDKDERNRGIAFYERAFDRMGKLGIRAVGGNMLNAPFVAPFGKYHEREWGYARDSLRKIASRALEYGIGIHMEVVNRYESHILNTAAEAHKLLDEVELPNAKMTLDSFHMNVEESSFANAVFAAGDRLGHFHLEENHRGLLGTGHLPLHEFRDALKQIGYEGILTMECLVRAGGELADTCRIWRDMTRRADAERLDIDAAGSVKAMKYLFAEGMR